MKSYFVAGGAGFVGSHLVEELRRDKNATRIVVYDNFSSGRRWHLAEALRDPRVTLVRGDIKDLSRLTKAMKGAAVVYHFAGYPLAHHLSSRRRADASPPSSRV
jgi:UDP-glucose 4-epimerase